MDITGKGLCLFLLNILFNLYTFYLLSNVYAVRTAYIYKCRLRGTASHLQLPTSQLPNSSSPLPEATNFTTTVVNAEIEPVTLQLPKNEISPEPKVEDIPEQRSEEFVIMVPSAKRPGGAFYAQACIEALLRAKVPGRAITVMNADVNSHPQLEAYLRSLNTRGTAVKSLERRYRANDLSVQNLKDFPFHVRPVETSDVGAQVAGKDTEERKRWRSKEAMDFVYISRHMLRTHEHTQWFVFLQDDAVLREEVKDLFGKLRDTIYANPRIPVFHLNRLGNVALMFHRSFLESYVAFANLRFDLMPIDWLLGKQKHALGTQDKLVDLFRHVGLKSSFAKNDRSKLVQ